MSKEKLEDKLVEAGYQDLFFYGRDSTIEGIWQKGKNKKRLQRLIKRSGSSLHAKFLAAEVLREYNVPVKEKLKPFLAEAYVKALENTPDIGVYQLIANLWGFLYEDDDPGVLGQLVIELGPLTVPYLAKLLDNEEMPLYEGSSEATYGSSFGYRIKDFAAYYLSKILNIPIQFYRDLKERDAEIERFKKRNQQLYG